jgi:hypothetical protein
LANVAEKDKAGPVEQLYPKTADLGGFTRVLLVLYYFSFVVMFWFWSLMLKFCLHRATRQDAMDVSDLAKMMPKLFTGKTI